MYGAGLTKFKFVDDAYISFESVCMCVHGVGVTLE